MKISQDVRQKFGQKFVDNTKNKSAESLEAEKLFPAQESQDFEAEKGMQEMSEKFKKLGSQVYLKS
jgi:hypothetical protein